jgi:hypothetical protein
MWLTGARFDGKGDIFFMVSYVEKNMPAGWWWWSQCWSDIIVPSDRKKFTSWCTTNHNTPDAFVYSTETTGAEKSLGRLQTRFYGVDWKKQYN